jgi:hypothetical protein
MIIKVKTKLKITNPQNINTKNLCLDKSIVEITYMGHEASQMHQTIEHILFINLKEHENTVDEEYNI